MCRDQFRPGGGPALDALATASVSTSTWLLLLLLLLCYVLQDVHHSHDGIDGVNQVLLISQLLLRQMRPDAQWKARHKHLVHTVMISCVI
jgi:hypothetical protein